MRGAQLTADRELLHDFLEEGDKYLDEASEQVKLLQRGSDDLEVIEAVLRPIHTLKSDAAFVALSFLQQGTHEVEELLDALMRRTLRLSQEVQDLLAFSINAFRLEIQQVRIAMTTRGELPSSPEIKLLIEGVRNVMQRQDSDIGGRSIPLAIGNTVRGLELDLEAPDHSKLLEKTGPQRIRAERVLRRAGIMAKEIAAEQGKDVTVELEGNEIELPKKVFSSVNVILIHLVRNAVAHGIEVLQKGGKISIAVAQDGGSYRLSVSDNGSGIGEKRDGSFDWIFQPGASSQSEVSTLSGRGIGLDAVQHAVSQINGTIDVQSSPKGAAFTINF